MPDSIHSISNVSSLLATTALPVLIFSGEFDPITPQSNGLRLAKKINTATHIDGHTYGHAPGFTRIGKQVTTAFVTNDTVNLAAFKKAKELKIATDIAINGGIAAMGNSINSSDILFMAPLIIALGIMLIFVFVYTIRLIKKKYEHKKDILLRILTVVSSFTGVALFLGLAIGLLDVSGQNFFILAFGLTDNFTYLFLLRIVFVAFVLITAVYFAATINTTKDRSIVFSVLFSNILIVVYLLYWGIV